MAQTTPILSLPDELIAEVAAVDTPLEWTLSHVCRRFRNAVVGTPALWTTVPVDLTHEGAVQISQLYFDRSASLGLSVTLKTEYKVAESLAHFVPHIPRVVRLTVVYGSYYALETLLESFRDVSAPCLQHLQLENNCEQWTYPSPIDLSPLQASPITSLKLRRCSPRSPLPRWKSALTHLGMTRGAYLEDLDGDVFLGISKELPSLTHFYFRMAEGMYSLESGIASESLTNLHLEFDAYSNDAQVLVDILAPFRTPHLTHLSIHGIHEYQISALFTSKNTDWSLPALTSLAFTNAEQVCSPEIDEHCKTAMASWQIFPVLSALTFVNQCGTAQIISRVLGSDLRSSLRTVVLWPLDEDVEDVGAVLREVGESLAPVFRVSPALFECGQWQSSIRLKRLEATIELHDGLCA
ncbi:hypothetical protein FB45DRAFT_36198 [Roridomyces roridus]|uniref:F-box domain-containing protein n=1 Tax=Roridomyces roridus TaxID=1738132 RepID=A0AAD7FM45_9AGAR|nr:hypothetical protein FB45DRAFT_36198 [Roridomyces roridus]